MSRGLTILGSTGSIGRAALEVVAHLAPMFRVVGLAARSNSQVLSAQVRTFRPKVVAFGAPDAEVEEACRQVGATLVVGEDAVVELSTDPEVEVVLNALVGAAGLVPTLRALEAGKTVALANKESLVIGGHLVMEAGSRERILPVDSEHAALHVALRGRNREDVRALWLTASGGALRDFRGDLSKVTPQQALAHPTWQMGKKVTVDSATMMNKGLEIIEAHFLFGIPVDSIHVVMHPESVLHSLVELWDGSMIGHLAWPDMRGPIQYALTYPALRPTLVRPLFSGGHLSLTFRTVDPSRYPCLALARQAAARGGTLLAAMNAANEVAVDAFLQGRIAFTDIPRVVEEVMSLHSVVERPSLREILEADAWAREEAQRQVATCGRHREGAGWKR